MWSMLLLLVAVAYRTFAAAAGRVVIGLQLSASSLVAEIALSPD